MTLAALCHDIGHRGRTNAFEMNTLSDIAIKYHDTSILEQYHAALALKLLLKPQYNILKKIKQEIFNKIRKILIDCILATDMKHHFPMIEELEKKTAERIESEKSIQDVINDEWKMIAGYCTHFSDLSGNMKKVSIARKWSVMISKEFSEQVRLFY